eukprot:465874-Pelagomonas_calceolata.AAC.1
MEEGQAAFEFLMSCGGRLYCTSLGCWYQILVCVLRQCARTAPVLDVGTRSHVSIPRVTSPRFVLLSLILNASGMPEYASLPFGLAVYQHWNTAQSCPTGYCATSWWREGIRHGVLNKNRRPTSSARKGRGYRALPAYEGT